MGRCRCRDHAFRSGNAGLSASGRENFEPGKAYVVMSNHASLVDIPAMMGAIPGSMRMVTKEELTKLPVWGQALLASGFIPIDRKNRRTAVKSFELAAERIRKGNTIVVFPEEGRSRERTMKPFQRGAFLLAMKSEQPIVPLAVQGTFDVYNARSRWIRSGVVTIRAGTPIATAGLSLRDKDRLLRESRAQIHAMLFGRPEDPAPAASEPPE